MKSTIRGGYSNYNQYPCQQDGACNTACAGVSSNKVRTWNQHPIQTLFNTPDRKPYVVENRTEDDVIISIGLKPWENEVGEVYYVIPRFCEKTLFVNTGKQAHHFLKVHSNAGSASECSTSGAKKIIDAKYLNPVYSLATIVKGPVLTGGVDLGTCNACQYHIQLQVTPGW